MRPEACTRVTSTQCGHQARSECETARLATCEWISTMEHFSSTFGSSDVGLHNVIVEETVALTNYFRSVMLGQLQLEILQGNLRMHLGTRLPVSV
jgi:hypothetical protein